MKKVVSKTETFYGAPPIKVEFSPLPRKLVDNSGSLRRVTSSSLRIDNNAESEIEGIKLDSMLSEEATETYSSHSIGSTVQRENKRAHIPDDKEILDKVSNYIF